MLIFKTKPEGLVCGSSSLTIQKGGNEMENLSITFVRDLGESEVEVVERKGVGHPDTIADALAENLSVIVHPPQSTFYLGFNMRSPAVSDLAVREAIERAIDKREITSVVTRTSAEVATGPLPPALWERDANPTAAADADSLPADPDLQPGTLRAIGLTLSGRTAFFYDAILQQLTDRGLTTEGRYSSDWDSYFLAREQNDYELFFGAWGADILGDPYFFLHDLFSSGSPYNAFRFAHAEVDSLLNRMPATGNRHEREQAYTRVLGVVREEMPAIFIYHSKEIFVVNHRLSPIVIDPYGYIRYEQITSF